MHTKELFRVLNKLNKKYLLAVGKHYQGTYPEALIKIEWF